MSELVASNYESNFLFFFTSFNESSLTSSGLNEHLHFFVSVVSISLINLVSQQDFIGEEPKCLR